jgi:hypothetical protein
LSPSAHVIGGPGGAGRPEEEQRKRSTWLAEDRDVWGVNEELAPPVISGLNPATPANERPTHGDNADRRAGAGSENSGTAWEADEKDDLDLLLDELEAELDLEIAELGEEVRGATEEKDPALGDSLDGLLGDHVGDAADAGDRPRTAR